MDTQLLTVRDVAELLQVNEQTVRNWIDSGQLAALRAGPRRVRIRPADLDRFLEVASPEDARRPEGAGRESLNHALDEARLVSSSGSDEDLASALERLATSAEELAALLRSTA